MRKVTAPPLGIRVLLYSEHPVFAAGVRSVLNASAGFEMAGCCDSLEATLEGLRSRKPDIVLIHLASRISLVELNEIASAGGRARMVLWGDAIGSEFAYQAMLIGARGILPGRTSIEALQTSLLNVHRGVLCFEKDVIDRTLLQQRVAVTRREGQILTLIARGFKNKAIGSALGITEGTVKAYMYKLFRKLGVNDRLDMALYGLKNLYAGQATLDPVGDPPAFPSAIAGPWTLPSHRVN